MKTLRDEWGQSNNRGFLEYLEQIRSDADFPDHMPIAEQYNKALKEVLENRDTDALQYLSNDILAELAKLIISDEFKDDQTLHEIYKHYDPNEDADFVAFVTERKIEMAERFQNDPIIRNAQENWDDMNIEERLEVAKYIHNIQAKTYGFKPVDVNAEAIGGVMSEVEGQYNSRLKDISLDSESPLWGLWKTGINNDFNSFFDTMIHEGDHAFQDVLRANHVILEAVKQYWLDKNSLEEHELTADQRAELKQFLTHNADIAFPPNGANDPIVKTLIEGGGLQEVAKMMSVSFTNNTEAKGIFSIFTEYGYYKALPHEQHSWEFEGFAQSIFGENAQEYIEELREKLARAEQQVQDQKAMEKDEVFVAKSADPAIKQDSWSPAS